MVIRKLFFLLIALTTLTAVHAKDVKEIYKEAKALYDAKNYAQAVPMLKVAAEKGYKKAQYRLGRCYQKGHGVEKNVVTAAQWYQKSANQDYAKAQYQLGKAYLIGRGVTADEKKARSLLKKAVKNSKHGSEILDEIKKDAADGDETAQRILKIVTSSR